MAIQLYLLTVEGRKYNMTTISHNHQFERLSEFSQVFEDFQSSRKSIRKYFGILGLTVTLPFHILSLGVSIRFQSLALKKALKVIEADFNRAEEREKMKTEAKVVRSIKTLESKLLPVISKLEKKNLPFTRFFVKSALEYLNQIKSMGDMMTFAVYPERIDPAKDPVLFDRLKQSYKNVDLSDWKGESNSIYDTLYPNNACV
ncbi:hypothetical protein [Pedobacter nototheniae]|uniref:hypothetical protein n=1 Tax=Pedobacter nototheniae TaxID=2488994 RepID=UPI001039C4A9|nr:hypothetical protein [Pedobacter nototheniae]